MERNIPESSYIIHNARHVIPFFTSNAHHKATASPSGRNCRPPSIKEPALQQVVRRRTNGPVDYRVYPSLASPFLSVYLCFHQSVSAEGGDRERREKDRSEDTGKRTKRIGVRDRNFEAMFAKIVNLLVGAHTCIGTVPFYFGSRFSLSFSHTHTHTLCLYLCLPLCLYSRAREEQSGMPFCLCLCSPLTHYLSPIVGIPVSTRRFYSWL